MIKSRGNILVVVLLIGVAVALSTGGFWWWKNTRLTPENGAIDLNSIPPTTVPVPTPKTPSPMPLVTPTIPGWKVYYNKAGSFTFEYPADWDEKSGVITSIIPDEQNRYFLKEPWIKFDVLSSTNTGNMTVDDYLLASGKQNEATMGERVIDRLALKVNGIDAIKVLTQIPDSPTPVVSYYFKKGSFNYSGLVFYPSDSKTYQETIEQIVSTFNFR